MFEEKAKRFEYLIAVAVLAVLLFFTYAFLFAEPYGGIQFNSSAEVIDVFMQTEADESVRLSDSLVSIGEVSWEQYADDPSAQFFEGLSPGEEIEVVVERAGQQIMIDWPYPGFNQLEFRSRLFNVWLLGYAFWIAGVATLLLVRPRDKRRSLLAAFNFVTAVWLVAGATSANHTLGAYQVLRAAIWISLPVYLHFHWNFPRQLANMPTGCWWALYAAGVLGGILHAAGLLPAGFYIWPFALAIFGSAGLTLAHFILRPDQRRIITLLLFALGLSLLPTLVIALSVSQPGVVPESRYLPGLLLSLIFLPFAYFYVLYRGHPDDGEFRANRLISLYILLMLLMTVFFAFLPVLSTLLMSPENVGLVVLIILVIVSVSVLGFNSFQRFVERRILRMPLPPEGILETYADRISTSITPEHLVFVLKEEVLPSLLIRQSHLYRKDERGAWKQLFSLGAPSEPLSDSRIEALARQQNESMGAAAQSWVREALPLDAGGELVGLWLLGRKDPDDHYSAAELSVLKALADQTAIALVNIAQARRLRALYQANIERNEVQRADLARELHDEVLGSLGDLAMKVGDESYTPEFERDYHQLNDRIRSAIKGLRPPMLSFGLYKALEGLVEELDERSGETSVSLEVEKAEEIRFEPKVEQHLFRIVQQACENAFHHAEAAHLVISGELAPAGVHIQVQDDGKGFALGQSVDLVSLLEKRHFGLAGMHERADLIDANLQMRSQAGLGTTIVLSWDSDET